MKAAGVVHKRGNERAQAGARETIALLETLGFEALVTDDQQGEVGAGRAVSTDDLGPACEFVVCLGGDGTLLHCGRMLRETPTPILGINMGHLGFLTPFYAEEIEVAVKAAVAGELPVQRRMRLEVRRLRAGEEEVVGTAANDVVISQGALARLMVIEARFDGRLINAYRADGLIVATPTGSTAYNLAAGGPLLWPGLETICLTPICPHTLTNRSLVVPSNTELTLAVGGGQENAVLTIDGQEGFRIQPDDRITVRQADLPLLLYAAPDRDHFHLMRTKLRWGDPDA